MLRTTAQISDWEPTMTFIHVLTFLKDKKENKVGLGEKENKNYS